MNGWIDNFRFSVNIKLIISSQGIGSRTPLQDEEQVPNGTPEENKDEFDTKGDNMEH